MNRVTKARDTPQVTWAAFEGFSPPIVTEPRTWSWLDQLAEAGVAIVEPECKDIDRLVDRYSDVFQLTGLGRDPSAVDWTTFRPLRVDREEDWSDWLAYLIERSTSGLFAAGLFAARIAEDFASPFEVERERGTPNDRRADIVIRWSPGRNTHMEVKIWDQNFNKTIETAQGLRQSEPEPVWSDFILIPESARDQCGRELQDAIPKISIITWEEVATSLRRALVSGKDDVAWNVWAFSFCGIIEQKILDLPRTDKGSVTPRISQSGRLEVFSRILKEGLAS